MDKLFYCVIVSMLCVLKGNAQRITLAEKDAALSTIFKNIEKQSGYFFLYESSVLKDTKPVTINIKDMALLQALDLVFDGQPVSYKIFDHNIAVRVKENKLLRIGIHGIVTNEKGIPIAGVSVSVRNSRIGTVTDEAGRFVIPEVPADAILVFSGANVEPQELSVQGQSEIMVTLKARINKLDEVQVIAYGTTTRRLSTGSYSKITSSEIESQPITDPIAAIQGRAPGVFITQSNGLPGSVFNMLIRGQNSISSGNQPLFLIDGVPFSNASMTQLGSSNNTQTPFASINPADIENIEILKDADATAIYGSRGANGVVLITTKKGRIGKLTFNMGAYTGFGRITRSVPFMNTRQYLAMRREALANDSIIPDAGNAPDLIVWDTTVDQQWQKKMIGGTAHTTDAQAGLSGGDRHTQFMVGLNFHHQSTVYPGSAADNRAGLYLNNTHRSSDNKFLSSLNITYSFDNNRLLTSDLTNAINTTPDSPNPYDSAGNLNWSEGGANFRNPLAVLLRPHIGLTDNLIGQWNLSYQIWKGFVVKTNLGYTNTTHDETSLTPLASLNPLYGYTGGFSSFANNRFKSWIAEPQAEYFFQRNKTKLSALLGTSWQSQTNSRQVIYAFNYSNDALLADPGSAGSSFLQSSNSTYRYQALFGRINYNFDDRILVNITGRRDGSSRFGPSRRYANFGAIGAAWIFVQHAEETQNSSLISFGKLRASYGITGNDQIGDYQYEATWQPTQYPYLGEQGLLPARLANPGYAWELNRKMEAGLELGFWKNHLLISIDYYRNRSSNQLINYSLPIQTGFNSIIRNLPAIVQNQGLELELTSTNIRSNDLTWTSGFNVTIARNELIAFPGLASSSYANLYAIGEPLSIVKLFKYQGVDPKTGVFSFNGVSIPKDQTNIGNTNPLFYGAFSNTLQYKKWKLDFLIQFVSQKGRNFIPFDALPGYKQNQPVWIANHWQKQGDIAAYQKYSAGYNAAASEAFSNYRLSDASFSDASYIRLKNVNLNFSCTKNITLYLQAQNLFTWTRYQGFDPESQNFLALPPLRVFVFGFRFTL